VGFRFGVKDLGITVYTQGLRRYEVGGSEITP
jgi:hypothetical protein